MVSTGTGFFFSFCRHGDVSIPAIVTNKHVVKDAITSSFSLDIADDSGTLTDKRLSVRLDNSEHRWIKHPDDDVDLCVLPIAPLFSRCESGTRIFFKTFDASSIPTSQETESFSCIDEITMIGYPNGLWDFANNLPIVRRGITATPYKFDYVGKKEFLIDSACFPGSSGSPVLLYNEGAYSTVGTINLGGRLRLLGVMYAGPQMDMNGEIVLDNNPKVVTRGMINLGLVIKSERLLEFEPLLAAQDHSNAAPA